MGIKSPVCITFAGVVGSSKTPIAHYLSCKLGLPIFSNDALRNEVLEDLGTIEKEEYLRRRDERLKDMLRRKASFIYDASVDREWPRLHKQLIEAEYRWFVISLDLSKIFLSKQYATKRYKDSLKRLDQLIKEHKEFLVHHVDKVGLHIADHEFFDRFEICYQTINNWVLNH